MPSIEKKPPSLHQRMLSDIQQLILTGAWAPGSRIPIEQELMKQYNCSRMTVSKVLTQLANARMIERRRKSGSVVSRPHALSAVLTIPDIKSEVAALGLEYSFQILRKQRRRSSIEERAVLGVERSIPVLEIACCHFAGPRPFCLEQRIINLESVPEAGEESFEQMAPGAWLLHRVPWTLAEHRIRAAEADPEMAKTLKIRAKSPVLTIERTTRSAEAANVTFVKLAYPADLHELVATFSPPGELPGENAKFNQPG